MTYKRKSIVPFIKSVIPNHIVDSNSLLPEFVEAYYAWLNQPQNVQHVAYSIENLADIDRSLDEFVEEFSEEYLSDILEHAIVDKSLLIKHLSDLYKAKGSTPSYELFFRLLYGKDVEIFYPREQMLIASDGKWIQEIALFATPVSGDIMDLVGKEVTVNTQQVPVKVFVEKIIPKDNNIYQIYINKNYYGSISVGDTLQYGSILALVEPTTTKISIVTPGSGFFVGQLFNITTDSGSGTTVKVTEVDSSGGLKKLQIFRFGSGYVADFFVDLSSNDTRPSDTAVSTPTTVTAQDYVIGFIDSGYISEHDYFTEGYADGAYVGEILATFYNDSTSANDPNRGIVKFELGAVARYPGYYGSNDGFISDTIYIQDSKYYQAYSYVIRIDQELESYKELVKGLLHPAGFAMFGEYQISHNINLALAVQSLSSILRLTFVDSVISIDNILINMTKGLEDMFSTSEAFTIGTNKVLTDSAQSNDDGGYTWLNAYVFDTVPYFSEEYNEGKVTF